MRRRTPRVPAVPLLAAPLTAPFTLVLAVALTGCTGAVPVDPAPSAADPACAEVLRAVPDELAGLTPRETTAQSAQAWGDPPVVLRCGVAPLGPTDEVCLEVEAPDGTSIDWVAVLGGDGARFTTYGRVPALEVVVPAALTDDDGALPGRVLAELAGAAALAEAERACVSGSGA